MAGRSKHASVADYIAAAPPRARAMLREIRKAIHAAAPQAKEQISYGMPYYSHHGRLAYFGAFREHVSYYVMSSPTIEAKYAARLDRYRTTRATLRFPLGSKVPVGLIRSVVKARAKENAARATGPRGRKRG